MNPRVLGALGQCGASAEAQAAALPPRLRFARVNLIKAQVAALVAQLEAGERPARGTRRVRLVRGEGRGVST